MRQRIIVCPLIENDNAFLLCKMAAHKGVFPGQWALSGGGVEPGEQIEQALRREVREELGAALILDSITPDLPRRRAHQNLRRRQPRANLYDLPDFRLPCRQPRRDDQRRV